MRQSQLVVGPRLYVGPCAIALSPTLARERVRWRRATAKDAAAHGSSWPDVTVQTCVVDLVRNSLRYASKKYWPQITAQLREIYTAPAVEAAENRFGEFAEQWRDMYPDRACAPVCRSGV